MPLVASVDYPNKRILLSATTMDADLDTLLVYQEVVALRIADADHRKYPPIIEAGGNVEKVAGVSYTLPYARLLGSLIKPYNSSHRINLIRDTFTDTGQAGRDCFDRTGLTAGVMVDIDVDIKEVEVRVVTVGGANIITGDITAPETLTAIAAAVAAAAAADPFDVNVKKVVDRPVGGTGVPPTFNSEGVMTDPGDPLVLL